MSNRRLSIAILGAALLAILLLWFRPAPPASPSRPISDLQSPDSDRDPPSPTSDLRPPVSEKSRPNLKRLLTKRDARPNEAVITFKDAEAYRRFLDRAQKLGLAVLGQIDALRTVRIRYDSLAALENDLLQHGADYADVSANFYVRIPEPPAKADRANVSQIPLRNGSLAFLGATGDRSTWGRGTTIAVIDSGVAPDPTFGSGRIQYLNIGLGTLPGNGPEDGHGTAIAALAAGFTDDAPGVAPAASVLSLRVTGADGMSDIFTVAQAILAAVNAGAPIINISLGGYQTTALLDAAIAYATSRGTLIVAAAGNDQAAQLAWPAADPRVVSVGAVDAAGQQVTFSNSGPQLQIAAPGYGVQTAWLDGQRVYIDGTSASAPLVAGAIAAVMSQSPNLTAAQAWAVVQQTVSDAGAPGTDPDYGHGILNLDWAMNYTNPAHTDPAVSAHYYDSANSQLDVIVQNRSAQTVSDLRLDVDTNGFTTSYRVPTLASGASYVVKVPVDQKTLAANGALTFTSDLVTPIGLADVNSANNRRTSRLVAPGP
jgi:hypothetical protein